VLFTKEKNPVEPYDTPGNVTGFRRWKIVIPSVRRTSRRRRRKRTQVKII